MTHIERYIMLVTAVSGKKPSNSQLKRIASDFAGYRRDQIEAAGFDQFDLTKPQQASVVLDALAYHFDQIQGAMFQRRKVEQIKAEAANLPKIK